jgi:hypothetical protein
MTGAEGVIAQRVVAIRAVERDHADVLAHSDGLGLRIVTDANRVRRPVVLEE